MGCTFPPKEVELAFKNNGGRKRVYIKLRSMTKTMRLIRDFYRRTLVRLTA